MSLSYKDKAAIYRACEYLELTGLLSNSRNIDIIMKMCGEPKGTYQCQPVETNRRADDFIAIEFPSGYVLIEPMKDHLKCCSPKGYRGLSCLY